MKIKKSSILILLFFITLAVAAAALFIGSVRLPVYSLSDPAIRTIIILRLSRAALAAVAGASLAVAGAVLQGLLKNPLADPYILGVSSGSGLGAVLAIIFTAGTSAAGSLFAVPGAAFLGGVVTIYIVYLFSKKSARVGTEDLLLSGVIITAMLSGIIMFLVSSIESEGLHNILWWLLGNTQIYNMRLLVIVAATICICITACLVFARALNIMSLGEEEAIALGLDVEQVKLIFFLISSLMVAVTVSVCGMIGFVGLIIPHAVRRLFGPDHRVLIPASAFCGAVFLVICDIIARSLMPPQELPVGVITALCGGPFFIILIKKSRRPGQIR